MASNSLRIVDVSNNNEGQIDWHAVAAAGVAGAIIKRSEGTGFADPDFDANWQGARAAGLLVGAYHFAHPEIDTPQAEAHFFLSLLPALQTGESVALDIEVGSGAGDKSAWALAWLQAVETALGFPPMLYSYERYIITSLQGRALARYPLWLANYTRLPDRVPPWSEVALWQHTDQALVAGIHGRVDESLIARDLAGLRALGKPAPTRTIAVACALKLAPNHVCPALAPLAAGTQVRVLGGVIHTDDAWLQVVAGSEAGYVPAAKLGS